MARIAIWGVLALCLAAVPALAQLPYVSQNELLGSADLVIVGTPLSDTRLPNVPDWQAMQAVVRVDRVLKGTATGNITVRHAAVPIMPPGMMITDHGGFTLELNKPVLLFLAHAQGGYTIVGGGQGRRPAEDADVITQALKEFPYSVTLQEPVGPLYFNRAVAMTMTVTNNSALPVQVVTSSLEGYFYSSYAGASLTFQLIPPALAAAPAVWNTAGRANPTTIEPGKSFAITGAYAAIEPENWRLLSPDTYFITPAAVRASVFVLPMKPNAPNNAGGFRMASPWINTWVGFPPPA